MKIAINLASQPFRRDRAMIAASAAVSIVLAVMLGGMVWLILVDRAQLADVRRDISQLNQQIRQVSTNQGQMDTVLRKPENAEVLERSLFLNALLARKGISWTKIFSDLEKTLPYNVKVVQIHPSIDAQDQVKLDMIVAAEQPGALIEMLKSIRESPLFGDTEMQNHLTPTQSEPLYRLRVIVPYVQRL